ncbi:hypothetical protein C3L33_21747, partial [Rhododendron williamsianum]
MMGNFVNPAYCVPSSHHPYQGFGVPPYGMPFVDGAISNVVKPRATKERSELQGISTASSPTVGARGITVSPTTGGRNALPHFLTSQAVHVPAEAPQLHVTDKPARVIKVVPRNAMSRLNQWLEFFSLYKKEGNRVILFNRVKQNRLLVLVLAIGLEPSQIVVRLQFDYQANGYFKRWGWGGV